MQLSRIKIKEVCCVVIIISFCLHVCCCCFSVEYIVQCINKSLDGGTPEETHSLLKKSEGMFPKVLPRSAFLYHDGLSKAKQVRVCFFTEHLPEILTNMS